MSGQIKTNEEGFHQAAEELKNQIQMWELKNDELLKALNELDENWKGRSSHSYVLGSECIYATSMQKQRDLSQLRSDTVQAYLAMKGADIAHSLSILTNIVGGK